MHAHRTEHKKKVTMGKSYICGKANRLLITKHMSILNQVHNKDLAQPNKVSELEVYHAI